MSLRKPVHGKVLWQIVGRLIERQDSLQHIVLIGSGEEMSRGLQPYRAKSIGKLDLQLDESAYRVSVQIAGAFQDYAGLAMGPQRLIWRH